MKNFMPCCAIALCMFMMIACGNPALNKKYNDQTIQEDFKAIAQSVDNNDLRLLTMYIVKAKFTGRSLVGKTYQDILDDAKKNGK